jgi:nicotinamide phosphoribosyltransferase
MLHFQNLWNIMLATDSYKASHHNMLPEDLEYMESYGESRGGEYTFTMFFGLQYYLKSYLTGIQVTEEKIQEAVTFYNAHFGIDNVFNEEGWRYIMTEYDGKLPIRIEAVKEGSIVPTKTMLYKIVSTDKNKKTAWLVNWVETLIMKTWYPITVATNSMLGREFLEYHWEKSGEVSNVDFLLHDFGYRGVASEEQAWIGGAAHLLNFKGTDTIAGIRMLMNYYDSPMCGYSVPATEHMVMTIRGRDMEIETYRQIFRKYAKGTRFENSILSLVSDTYDMYNVKLYYDLILVNLLKF